MIEVKYSKSGFKDNLNGAFLKECDSGVIVELSCEEDSLFEEDKTDIMIDEVCQYMNDKYFKGKSVVKYRGVIVNRSSEYYKGKHIVKQLQFQIVLGTIHNFV